MAPYDKQQKHTLYYTNTVYTCGNAIVTGRSSSEKEGAGNRFANLHTAIIYRTVPDISLIQYVM